MTSPHLSPIAHHATDRDDIARLLDRAHPELLPRLTAMRRELCAARDTDELHAFALLLGGSVRAVAVFAADEDRRLTALGAEFGHAVELAAMTTALAEQFGAAVRRLVRSRFPGWTVSAGPFADGADTRAFGRGLGMTARFESVPVIRIDSARPLRHHLSENRDKTLRRMRNRVARECRSVQFVTTCDPDALTPWLDPITALKRDRAIAHGDNAVLQDGRLHLWRRRLLAHFQHGSARLDLLLLEGAVAAYNVSLVQGRAWRVWEGYAAQSWSRFSPGRLLESHLLETALGLGNVDLVDWMTSVAPEAILASNGTYATLTFSGRLRPSGSRSPAVAHEPRVPARRAGVGGDLVALDPTTEHARGLPELLSLAR